MKKITMGTGITARTVELVPATRDSLNSSIRALGGVGDFDSRVAEIEAWAAQIDGARRQRGEKIGEWDSAEGYALRILRLIKLVRDYIAEGDASGAATFAFNLGIVFDEMLMKQEWEHPALVGVGRARSAKGATEKLETALILRVALAAILWNEAASEARLSKQRIGIVCAQLGRLNKHGEDVPLSERTLDDYLAMARAHKLVPD